MEIEYHLALCHQSSPIYQTRKYVGPYWKSLGAKLVRYVLQHGRRPVFVTEILKIAIAIRSIPFNSFPSFYFSLPQVILRITRNRTFSSDSPSALSRIGNWIWTGGCFFLLQGIPPFISFIESNPFQLLLFFIPHPIPYIFDHCNCQPKAL